MVKKADILLIVAALCIAATIWGILFLFPQQGNTVVIRLGNSVYGTYSLTQNSVITIDQEGVHNIVCIEDAQVYMKESNCAGQQCIAQGKISHSGESIVCLPNQIIIEITGEEGYDAVAS